MWRMLRVAMVAGVLVAAVVVDIAGAETMQAPACTVSGKACPPLSTTQGGGGPVVPGPAGAPPDFGGQPDTGAPPLPPCCKK